MDVQLLICVLTTNTWYAIISYNFRDGIMHEKLDIIKLLKEINTLLIDMILVFFTLIICLIVFMLELSN